MSWRTLREMTLGYNIGGAKVNNAFQNVRLYFTAANLAYFTGYTGALPEAGGSDTGSYPLPRAYTFGFNITF